MTLNSAIVSLKEITMSSPRKLALHILLPFTGVLAALVICEVGFRLFVHPPKRRWSDRPQLYFMPQESPTLRDGPYVLAKPADTFRIAVIGDSFSFGPWLQYDDTFPKRLERWLNLNREAPHVEVINFGKSGFSTHHEVNVMQRALRYAPDLVLLQITLNDAEKKPLTAEERDLIFGPPPFLKSRLFDLWRSGRYAITRFYNTRSHRLYLEYFNSLFQDSTRMERFRGALTKMRTMCNSAGAPLYAVIFPLFSFPIDDHYPFHEVHHTIETELHAQSIPSLDLTDSYRGIPHERLEIIPTVDSHPNEIAHRIAAEDILLWLNSRAALPPEILPHETFKKRKDERAKRATDYLIKHPAGRRPSRVQ